MCIRHLINMGLDRTIWEVILKAQMGSVNHQKCVISLHNLYKSVGDKKFTPIFIQAILYFIRNEHENHYVKVLLGFVAKFVSHVATIEGNQAEIHDEGTTSPFLTQIVQVFVEYRFAPQCTYNVCSLLSQIMGNLGPNTTFDNDFCNIIEKAMLEYTEHTDKDIRIQALYTLERLQNPHNAQMCPVIMAFKERIHDPCPSVRVAAVKKIAPHPVTLARIEERIRDVNVSVRKAAYIKISEIGMKYWKIAHRRGIVTSGFRESHPDIKNIFLQVVIPKWLTSVGTCLEFISSLRLEGDEKDVILTEQLCQKLINVFLITQPINDLINLLPLDEYKIIPTNKITVDLSRYWCCLVVGLRSKSQEMEEFLKDTIPELVAFCHFIEKFIKSRYSKHQDEFDNLDFQSILFNLLTIVEDYDFGDELGRTTLKDIIKNILRNHELPSRLLNKIVEIYRKLFNNDEDFTEEMFLLISEIMQPSIPVKQLTEDQIRDIKYEISRLQVKLDILENDMENAIAEKDFSRAQVLKNETEDVRKNIQVLKTELQPQPCEIEPANGEEETLGWRLDLLHASLSRLSKVRWTASLDSLWNEFLRPHISNRQPEYQWKIFRCLGLYTLFNDKIAEDNLAQILLPLGLYYLDSSIDRRLLIASISCVGDLILLRGTKWLQKLVNNGSNEQSAANNTRRLYTAGADLDDATGVGHTLTMDDIINIILDMLDDEEFDLRETAIHTLGKLLIHEAVNSPAIITRIILKWYNPTTGIKEAKLDRSTIHKSKQHEAAMQQYIGLLIEKYIQTVPKAVEVVAQAVLPILKAIDDAPMVSPLGKVDVHNVVNFLASISNNGVKNNIVQRTLAHQLLHEIQLRPTENINEFLAKLLMLLNLGPDDESPSIKEILVIAQRVAQQDMHRNTQINLQKFIQKLSGVNRDTNGVDNEVSTATENITSSYETTDEENTTRGSTKRPRTRSSRREKM